MAPSVFLFSPKAWPSTVDSCVGCSAVVERGQRRASKTKKRSLARRVFPPNRPRGCASRGGGMVVSYIGTNLPHELASDNKRRGENFTQRQLHRFLRRQEGI